MGKQQIKAAIAWFKQKTIAKNLLAIRANLGNWKRVIIYIKMQMKLVRYS